MNRPEGIFRKAQFLPLGFPHACLFLGTV
uniref:Uncharacterized protein n=1 Tax=Rhizophora mucronata TaxID=61149 RepID=A0A2P2PJE6_RHIMU